MTNKAYIVVNEQQEREVLEKLERLGAKWRSGGMPTKRNYLIKDTLIIFVGDDNQLSFDDEVNEGDLVDYEILFDGRKEEHMSDKYVVSQEFMNELMEWKSGLNTKGGYYVDIDDVEGFPEEVYMWWGDELSHTESNNRLIAIIRWVNGKDVFEVEKPKKWVVHELNTELYVTTYDGHTGITPNRDYMTKFDTKEEAQSWANSHQEVIEVEG